MAVFTLISAISSSLRVSLAVKVIEDESEHILEATYTCNGDKPIVKNKKLKELFLATLGIIPNVNGIDLRKVL